MKVYALFFQAAGSERFIFLCRLQEHETSSSMSFISGGTFWLASSIDTKEGMDSSEMQWTIAHINEVVECSKKHKFPTFVNV